MLYEFKLIDLHTISLSSLLALLAGNLRLSAKIKTIVMTFK